MYGGSIYDCNKHNIYTLYAQSAKTIIRVAQGLRGVRGCGVRGRWCLLWQRLPDYSTLLFSTLLYSPLLSRITTLPPHQYRINVWTLHADRHDRVGNRWFVVCLYIYLTSDIFSSSSYAVYTIQYIYLWRAAMYEANPTSPCKVDCVPSPSHSSQTSIYAYLRM